MKNLQTGEFYGTTNTLVQLNSLTLTDTEYTHPYVDWHYHENAYFTFILTGAVAEGNNKEVYHCKAGSLLYHHWQEAHYNIKPKGFTRGFQVELKPDWFARNGLNANTLQGSISFQNPQLTKLMYNVFKEVKLDAGAASLAVDSLLTQLFDTAVGCKKSPFFGKPLWVARLKDLLHDQPSAPWTLQGLACELSIHPVHLSRDFAKHFNCNLGQYVRMLRVQAALSLLSQQQQPLTHIALSCGFADQSHFIRSFKALHQLTPLAFRKLFGAADSARC